MIHKEQTDSYQRGGGFGSWVRKGEGIKQKMKTKKPQTQTTVW